MSKSFLQSEKWVKFQEAIGRKTFRLDDILVIRHALPLGLSFLYSPRPLFINENEFKNFIKNASNLAKKERAIFLQFEPDIGSNFQFPISKPISNFHSQLSKNRQPQDTVLLDLGHNEETILAQMHQKTRYNIRLAERHSLKIEKTTDPSEVDIFYNLAVKTSLRDGFRYHPRAYYQKMLEVLGKDETVELFIAYQGKIPIAATLVLYFGSAAVYLHGASDHDYRNFMAPYLLQWQTIKEAKKRGCKTYDFWGVKPRMTRIENTDDTDRSHSWDGITRFKMGFAPTAQVIHYPSCQELIFSPFWYSIYQLARKMV